MEMQARLRLLLLKSASIVTVLVMLVATRNGQQHLGVEAAGSVCPADDPKKVVTYERFDNYDSKLYFDPNLGFFASSDLLCLAASNAGKQGSECRKKCDLNPACVGYAFYASEGGRCCTKHSVISWEQVFAGAQVVFWRKHYTQGKYQKTLGYDSNSGDIECRRTGVTRVPETCQTLCDNNDKCVGFNYVSSPTSPYYGCCYKHSVRAFAPAPGLVNDGIEFYTRMVDCVGPPPGVAAVAGSTCLTSSSTPYTAPGTTCTSPCGPNEVGQGVSARCDNGKWVVTSTCVEGCDGPPPPVSNGQWASSCSSASSKTPVLSGTTCTATCNTGYSGTVTANCCDGDWTTVQGSCTASG